MIKLTRLRGRAPDLVVNADLILQVDAHPNTVITLTNGQKLVVQESPDEVIGRVVDFRRRCLGLCQRAEGGGAG